MKIQDIFFFIILVVLFWKRDPHWAVVLGLVLIALSIPLFATWTFFTAERFTWYASAFFLLAVIFYLFKLRKN